MLPSHRIANFRHGNKHLRRRNVAHIVLFVLGMVWWQLQRIMALVLLDTTTSTSHHHHHINGWWGLSMETLRRTPPKQSSTRRHSSNDSSSSQVRDASQVSLSNSSHRVVEDVITAHDDGKKKLQQFPRASSSDEEQSTLRKPSTSTGEGRSNANRPRDIPTSTRDKLRKLLMNKRDSHPKPQSLIEMKRRVEKHVDAIVKNYSACTGKAVYLKLIFLGGRYTINAPNNDTDIRALCSRLPTQKRVEAMYGPEPIILGLDTCQYYRELLEPEKNNGKRIDPMPRVAGLYHTGTNLLTRTLNDNFGRLAPASDVFSGYEVPWGKHLPPAAYRLSHTVVPSMSGTNRHRVLPIVLIRDPYSWMQAMCTDGYDVVWDRPKDFRCPNLVQPNKTGTFKLRVNTHQTSYQYTDYYDSLADMWSTWYAQFLDADYPRLIIRFEDAMYRMEQVYDTIRECVGAPRSDRPFQFCTDLAKKHGKPTDFLRGLRKFVTRQGRYRGLNADDRDYSHQALNSTLMSLFQYKYAPLTLEPDALSGPFDPPSTDNSPPLVVLPADDTHGASRSTL